MSFIAGKNLEIAGNWERKKGKEKRKRKKKKRRKEKKRKSKKGGAKREKMETAGI